MSDEQIQSGGTVLKPEEAHQRVKNSFRAIQTILHGAIEDLHPEQQWVLMARIVNLTFSSFYKPAFFKAAHGVVVDEPIGDQKP